MTNISLKLICAWCSCIIRDGKEMLVKGELCPSHGICKTCYKKVMGSFLDQKDEKTKKRKT